MFVWRSGRLFHSGINWSSVDSRVILVKHVHMTDADISVKSWELPEHLSAKPWYTKMEKRVRGRAVRQRKTCLPFCHFYVSIVCFSRKKYLNVNLWPSKERL